METILEEAQRLVGGDRQDDYGHPLDCCDRIGRLWSVALGIDVPAEKVAECLGLMKYARLQQGYKRDTVVDIAGYAQVLQMIVDERERREDEKVVFQQNAMRAFRNNVRVVRPESRAI